MAPDKENTTQGEEDTIVPSEWSKNNLTRNRKMMKTMSNQFRFKARQSTKPRKSEPAQPYLVDLQLDGKSLTMEVDTRAWTLVSKRHFHETISNMSDDIF